MPKNEQSAAVRTNLVRVRAGSPPDWAVYIAPGEEAYQLFTNSFGIEIEFTGITRRRAAEVVAEYLGAAISTTGDYYDTHEISVSDASGNL